ncbi:MAG: LPP20 family lipoprotein [Bacteroidales bacterium]|nr:LPP20 family lipoprotein [Bacteroidales bacterium]
MKFIITTIVLFECALLTTAQSIESIKADRNTYLWGEGSATTLKKADNIALDMLISQISTEVESSFSLLKTEDVENEEYTYSETVKSVVNTYSSASLNNTERIVISNEPDAKVFRYIKRSEVNKIFEARKNKILGFVSNGNISLDNLQIADAIRYYYWAYTLLRSHPEGSFMKITTSTGEEQLLSTWLPFQLQSIFGSLEAKIVKVEKMPNYTQVVLNFTYNGKPVKNFDYSYWDGQNWSNIIGCKNGLGFADLSSASTDIAEIKLKAEYMFDGEAKSIDNELNDVFNKIDPVAFRDSYFIASKPGADKYNIEIISETVGLTADVSITGSYEEIITKFCNAVIQDDYNTVSSLFTEEGFQIYKQLIGFGRAKILKNDNLRFINYGNNVICRGISMSFSFANNTRSFVEDVVVTFDKNRKISDITLGLEQAAINDILAQDKWSETVRLSLIDFMEHYKTAFALKRLDYISNIFSDDALIITGWVIKTKPNPDMQYRNNEIIQYNHYTKEQYLSKLKYSFQSNEFINLKFNDNNIRKSGKGGEVYGIQIQQDYFSSSYGDSGYLFLLIDMNDSAQPTIHVRTWQPEKNADGSIYGVEDF